MSKKTVALVVGALAGETKKAKALELNIPIVDEQQFLNILETGEISSSQ